MDARTLQAYDDAAASFADDWLAQPAPEDMYDLLRTHFSPGPTADIGCGAGRDTAWLAAQGFDVSGYDASTGLLEQARLRYPGIDFAAASLPALAGLPEGHFRNILCETVIMHLDPAEVPAAVLRLLAILQVGGVLYLSWRVTDGVSQRDKFARLYAAFDSEVVLAACGGQQVLLQHRQTSQSSGKTIERLILRKVI